MSEQLQFDEQTHTYRIDGRLVPSVTQVIRDVLPTWQGGTEWDMQRGRAVHACAAMIARGEEFEHDPAITGQVEACGRFFAELRVMPYVVEKAVYSSKYQYAGTLDLIAELPWGPTVVDYKATLGPTVPYQLAAYSIAEAENNDTDRWCRWGIGVELRENGTYQLSEKYNLTRYRAEWLCLLTAWNVRRKCGIKEQQ